MKSIEVTTPSAIVSSRSIVADVEIPKEHDIIVSTRNFVLTTACTLGIADGSNLPEWLLDALKFEAIDNTADVLVQLDEIVKAMEIYIDNLEVGVNQQILSVQNDILSTNTLLTTNVSRLDNNTSAVLSLTNTKVTEERSSALALDVVHSEFNTPNSTANAWFINSASTMTDDISSNASHVTALIASFNDMSVTLLTTGYVIVGEDSWEVGASKMAIGPNGNITGWGFTDGSALQPTFTIAADYFYIENSTNPSYRPFSINGTDIVFNGSVSFNNVTDQTLLNDISTAQYTANSAYNEAISAKNVNTSQAATLGNIRNDGVLDPSEKLSLRVIVDQIKKEYPKLLSAATKAIESDIGGSISTTSYENAYSSLLTYVISTCYLYSATDTNISRSTFSHYFDTYYGYEEALRDAITERLKNNVTALKSTWGNSGDWTKIDGGSIWTNNLYVKHIYSISDHTTSGGGYTFGNSIEYLGSSSVIPLFIKSTGSKQAIHIYANSTAANFGATLTSKANGGGLLISSTNTSAVGLWVNADSNNCIYSSVGWGIKIVNATYGLHTTGKVYAAGGFEEFTGVHKGFTTTTIQIGDIISQTTCTVESISSIDRDVTIAINAKDKTVIGVCAGIDFDIEEICATHDTFIIESEESTGEKEENKKIKKTKKPKKEKRAKQLIKDSARCISINALGDGAINVCSEGGNIENGDYICSSNTAGKGMKQDDDILHNYTVAKALEDVDWSEEDNNTKMIACTYHCG